jgi:hypothetical protein
MTQKQIKAKDSINKIIIKQTAVKIEKYEEWYFLKYHNTDYTKN